MTEKPHILGHAPVSEITANKLMELGFHVGRDPKGFVLRDRIQGKSVAFMAEQLPQLEFVTDIGGTLLFWRGGRCVEQTEELGLVEVSKNILYPGTWYIARDTFCPEQRTYLLDGRWAWKTVPSENAGVGMDSVQDAVEEQKVLINCVQKALSRQEGGNHYQHFAIQPAEFIRKNKLSFTAGNVIKYVCRAPFKDGVKDLKKAQHYLEMLIEDIEEEHKVNAVIDNLETEAKAESDPRWREWDG